jgi:hypothetical protein
MPLKKPATSTVPKNKHQLHNSLISNSNMDSNSDLAADSEPEESVQMTEDNQEVEITPEQTEQIVMFSMLTGNEDLDECAKVLKVSGYAR